MDNIQTEYRGKRSATTRTTTEMRMATIPGPFDVDKRVLFKYFACGMLTLLFLQIPALRPREYSQISKPKKTVQRAYGGSRCANCVRDRIVRAFLIEEQKIVKKVLKESQQKKR